MDAPAELSVVVLISGSGSNLQALIDATANGLPARIVAVISNRSDAYGLERARRAGIPTQVLSHKGYPDRESYDAALAKRIDAYRPGLVVLAGFMRILSPGFVQHYQGRMLNIHPSLLPEFRGLHTHQRALEAGAAEHGASVHFVTEELDGGPLIIQARVPVLPGDDPETLAARVLRQEHRIYPRAVEWFALGRLRLERGRVLLDGRPLERPALIEPEQAGADPGQ
jgi:phosphoribosylglycinamide formyltransferase-1